MGSFKPVGRMATPTGPTGILDSGRTGVKSGGKKTLGNSKGLVRSPMKSMKGKR